MAADAVRRPDQRGRALGFAERGNGRGTRRRDQGAALVDFTLYMGKQLRRHRGGRALAIRLVADDLRMSPNDVELCRDLLQRRRALRHWAPVRYTDSVPAWRYRSPYGRPRRVLGVWSADVELAGAWAAAKRGPTAMLAWCAQARDELARLLDTLRNVRTARLAIARLANRKDAERATARDAVLGAAGAAARPPTPAPDVGPADTQPGPRDTNAGRSSRGDFTELRDALRRHFPQFSGEM